MALADGTRGVCANDPHHWINGEEAAKGGSKARLDAAIGMKARYSSNSLSGH